MSQSLARPMFGGHEKFAFRQGWPKKTVDEVSRDGSTFTRDDAFVTLGVGKNMAASMRYWGLALGLLSESATDKGRSRVVQVTPFGQTLLGDDGWDPYLEDSGSLWLLHWQLAGRSNAGALVWWAVFSHYADVEFRRNTLIDFLKKHLLQHKLDTTESMIERELDVFLRTYLPTQSRASESAEDRLDCPLVDLGLVRLAPGDTVYRFDVGGKPALPTAIFGYALCEFLAPRAQERRTAQIGECVYMPGSPGQVFKLDENSVMAYLEDLETRTAGALRLQETPDGRQIYLHAFSPALGWNLLKDYYA